ncbi:MAG: hypothetical protein ACE5D7_08445, partial [Fidelibacterota bacterium]
MKRLLLIINLICIQLLFSEFRNETLLFCLTPDTPPLEIYSSIDKVSISYPKLQQILDVNDVMSIERWLPSAKDTDHDGDIYLNRIYRITFRVSDRLDLSVVKSNISELQNVMSAEYEPVRKPAYVPNDPQYGQQWFLPQIGANTAWDYWSMIGMDYPGDESIILASVDTGVDWDHADLIDNIWQNLNEDADGDGHTLEYIGGEWVFDPGDLNGIDDDNWDNNSMTYIDDL